jgi:hypothetical protein
LTTTYKKIVKIIKNKNIIKNHYKKRYLFYLIFYVSNINKSFLK